jgi:hypothetical protein
MYRILCSSRTNLKADVSNTVYHLLFVSLAPATAAVAPADTTMAVTVVVASVPRASPVANGTSISAEDVASASVAHGRLPAAVPLAITLSATCGIQYAYHS